MSKIEDLTTGERLQEVMNELGFSKPNSFAKSIGMSHSTFGRILKDERPMTESSTIASGLGLTVERLLGVDMKKEIEKMNNLIESNPRKAIEIGELIRELCVGVTERVDLLNCLGKAYRKVNDFKACAEIWQKTLDILLEKKRNDVSRIERAVNNVIFAYGKTQEIEKRIDVVNSVESILSDDLTLKAKLLYTKGATQKLMLKYQDAFISIQSAINIYKELNNKQYIGRCLTLMGEIYYLQGEYSKALDMLNLSKERAFKDEFQFVQYYTELYIKVCVMLSLFIEALMLAKQVSEILGESKFNDVNDNGKILFYYETLTENIDNPRRLTMLASTFK